MQLKLPLNYSKICTIKLRVFYEEYKCNGNEKSCFYGALNFLYLNDAPKHH